MSTPSEIRQARRFREAQAHYDALAEDQSQFDDDESSMQELGDTQVQVTYGVQGGVVYVTGAYIRAGADRVEAHEFAPWRVDQWRQSIQREFDREAGDTQ